MPIGRSVDSTDDEQHAAGVCAPDADGRRMVVRGVLAGGTRAGEEVLRLQVRPRQTFTWESFRAARPGAVALDGVVTGPTRRSKSGHLNVNHHESVDRLSCRATCEQLLLLLGHGLWVWLAAVGHGVVEVFVNDADADVALSVWLLRNHDRIGETAVQRIVALEGAVDTAGGIWPDYVDEALIGELAWIFAPYDDLREGNLLTADELALAVVIDEVGERIDAWVEGRGGRISPSAAFDVIERRGDVVAVREKGPLARTAMRRAGFTAYVALREVVGARAVTIGALDPAADLDLRPIYASLNDLEGCEAGDRWGGSDTTIGGSPRLAGTHLSLSTILDVVSASTRATD